MPIITGDIVDATGKKDSREWQVWSPVYAESATGDVVSTRVRTINVTAGVFRASIDPGVVVLENPDGKRWSVTVPETDIDLWDLIALSAGLPPETPNDVVAQVVAQWLEDNPPETGNETDLTVSRTATTLTVHSSTGDDAVVPAADGSNAGVMTAAMQAKLAGVSTGATANATDAALRDRGTHTGQQTSATISDFTEAVQDAVAALLAAGTNVTLNYDDAGNTLTVTASGGGGGLDAEAVRDTIGVALQGVGNITVTANDALDTITITTTATVNSTDAALRDRSTHTGSQTASTISDFSTAADARVTAGITGKADKTTTVSAGTGLTGGGDLSTNRTLAVSYGTTAGTAAQGNDARLSDQRVPTDNSVTNAKMADDAVGIAELSATGTPSGSTYLRGDNTWAAPSTGGLAAQAAYVATAETIASGGAYADLTTTTDQVTIDVGASGVAVVSIGAWFGASAANAQAYISFAVSGANTSAAADSKCVYVRAVAGSSVIGGTESSFTLTGLTPGSTTFKMKYKAAGGTGTYEHRRISVMTF